MTNELEQELTIVSEAAHFHVNQIRQESMQGFMMIWINYHKAGELHAGAANLRAIKDHCENQELETQDRIKDIEESIERAMIEECSTTNYTDSDIDTWRVLIFTNNIMNNHKSVSIIKAIKYNLVYDVAVSFVRYY